MATFGWKLADDSGNPLTGPIDWTNSAFWVAYPVANPPVTGIVPGVNDSAFVIAGTVDVSTQFGSFNKSYPVTVDVTTSQTVTTLGLGGININGINFSTGAPTFGVPSVLPTLDINGGSLHVTGNVEDNFTGTITVATPIGIETFSGTFSDGGVIDLTGNGTLEVGGAFGTPIVADNGLTPINVDFDNTSDVLKLDGVNNTTPGAFAGVIQGFTVGNSIVLSALPALHTVTETYTPGVVIAGVLGAGTLTVTDSTLHTLATLSIQGTIPSNYTTANFALAKTANSVTITEVPSAPPPSFAWKGAVNGDWATAADWTPAGPPNAANADATIAVPGAYTVTIAAAESFLVDSLTFAPASGTGVLALNGKLTLGGTQAAMNESSGTVKLAGTIAGGTFTLNGGTLSDIGAGVISSAAVLNAGAVSIAAAKTLTLSGAATLGAVAITGPGTLATTGATSITAQTQFDGSVVWNNTGTVSAAASFITGYPSGVGKVTFNNQVGGAFDLTVDGLAFTVNTPPSGFALNNFGVFSKTAGTGVSQLTAAIANTGTLTATSGTLELDAGSALGGTIGATGAGLLALGGGTFTVAGTTQTITGALALEAGIISLTTGKTLTLAGPTTLGSMAIIGPGTLATTGATSIIAQTALDGSLVWNNSGTVSAGVSFITGYTSGVGKVTINNQIGGAFDLTADGQALTVNGGSTLAINNVGVLAKTVGTGISDLGGAINNTGTITTSTGTLELDGGGTLGGTVVETATGAVTLGAGVFAYTGAITGPGTLTVDGGATLAITTVSDSITNAVVLGGGVAIAAAKTLTLSGPVTMSGADIVGPGTLATAGTTSIVTQAILDGSLVWNNTGTVLAGANILTSYPSGVGTVTIANQTGGVFDLTVDGEALVVNGPPNLLQLSNAGVLSKTAGTGVSQIAYAVTNTGTLTATSGTLELDGGGTLGGTIGATGAGTLALAAGTFTVGGTAVSITGALTLGGGIASIAAGKTLTLAGTTTMSSADFTGPGILSTTGTATIVATDILDGSVVWNNTGTVLAGATVLTSYPSGAGTVTIANKLGGVFDLTADGEAFTVNGPPNLLTLSNAGVLSKTAGTGISQISTALTNTGTLTATTGTLELDGGGTLGGTVVETATGAVTLGAGVFAYTGAITGPGTLTVDSGATLALTTVSDLIANTVVLNGGVAIAAAKTLTLSGPVTLSGADIVGPGTLATAGITSIITQAVLDGSVVWNNTGTVLAGATVLTNYPSGAGTVTIANKLGGVFDLTVDGQAFTVNGLPNLLTLSNAGVLSKTAGAGISQISTALTNTGTLTATTGTLELDGGGTLGGTIGATGAGSLALNAGTFTLSGTTQSITGTVALGGGAIINLATGKTLTLAGPTTLNNVAINGPGTLATTGATSVTGQSFLDGSLVWNNTGTVSAAANLFTGLPSGAGNVTIANKLGGVFDLTADGQAFAINGGSTLALSNAGVLSKTAGTGISQIAVAVANTGTITATSGTLELDGGGTLSGVMGATGAGTLSLGSGTFAQSAAAQTISGALILTNGAVVDIAAAKTLTLSGPVSWIEADLVGPGTLATTGTTTFSFSPAFIDGGMTWNNTGTVLDTVGILVGQNSLANVNFAVKNQTAGVFNFTTDGFTAFTQFNGVTTFTNAGLLEKTVGTATTTFGAVLNNTGTVTSNHGTLDLNGGGNLAGTIGGTGTGLVLLDAGGSFTTTGTLAITDAGAANDLRIGNGGTLTDSGLINDSGHLALGNGVGASALVITAAGKFDFTADDGQIVNGTLGTLTNAGILAKTGGSGTSTIGVGFANTGTVDAASGILKLSGAVTGTGQMKIEAGHTLELATGAIAATNTVDFNGLGATLKIDNNAAVAKPIIGLAGGSRIDLGAATSATAVISGTTLTVTPTGGAALKFVSTTSLAALHATTGTDGGTGTVVTLYNQAAASVHTPEPVAFGNVHVGDTAVQAIAISNTAPIGIYSEKLDASLATAATGFTATGSITGLAAGGANNGGLTVALKTATSGNISGTATLTLSTDGAGVDGFAKAALTPQTVNVSGAVYAFAAPNLSTNTLNFGAARVGDTALAQSLTLGDGSSVNTFQESLVYSVGSGPAPVSFSNGSGTIASGGAVTVGATLATSTAGDFSGSTASLALTSTGVGTSGLADTALNAQPLFLNGKVYADAVANFSANSVNFGVVHVGVAVSQNLALTNGAIGALADSLTGGTDTLSGNYAGPVGFALGAGGLAEGASGSVSFGLNTALSGVVSGNAVFGFTSHDADLSDIGIDGGTIAVTGTVDNFATAQVEDTGGVGTFAGSNGNYTLNLGSVAQGGAALVGDLGVLNAATGLADLLSGTFAVTGAASFTNTGFTAGFSGLGAGQDERNQTISLSTATSGVLSETIVLTPTGSNANFSGVLTQETITVTGTIVPAGVTYTLTSAPITIAGGVGNDTVIVKNAMLNSHDSINGGGGTNTVQLSGPGSFDLGAPAVFANIQSVVAAEGQVGGAGSQIVYMRNAANLTLNVTTGIPVAGNVNPETITIYGAAASDVLNLGGGTDNVVLGGAAETVNGGGGIALLKGTAAFAGALVNGGAGKTTLELTTGGTATLNAADNNLTVKLDAITNLTLSKMSFITATGSTGADTITAMASGQTLTGAGGADVLTGFSGFGDTFADTAAGLNGDTLKLFGGNDVIDVTDVSSTLAKTLVYTGNTTAGTLAVSDGTHTANIKFTGNYTTANFQLATDNHTGSLITFVSH